jgi:hypothetical protein
MRLIKGCWLVTRSAFALVILPFVVVVGAAGLVAIIAFSALGVSASAEDCRKQFPHGPFRRECLDKQFPARIAKSQTCREADQMNLTNQHGKNNKAKRNYVEACMRR